MILLLRLHNLRKHKLIRTSHTNGTTLYSFMKIKEKMITVSDDSTSDCIISRDSAMFQNYLAFN